MSIYRHTALQPHHIGFLLIDGFALMSFSAVVEPLRAANLIAEQQYYAIDYYAVDKGHAESSGGAVINATKTLSEFAHLDWLFVVAGTGSTTFQHEKVTKLLRAAANQGVALGGVSAGPALLAQTGLLENRRFTLHWEHIPEMTERFPRLLMERSLYVKDRDRFTCAGGVAPLDMMNALLTEQHGHAFARRVSDWFIHTEIRPSASPQRSSLSERYPTASQAMILAIEAMQNHIADPLDLEQLAQLTDVSTRQLNRLFREKLGSTTMAFYRQLRLQTADKLLRQSSLKIINIAQATGFISAAHFAAAFHKQFGLSPSSIRSALAAGKK